MHEQKCIFAPQVQMHVPHNQGMQSHGLHGLRYNDKGQMAADATT